MNLDFKGLVSKTDLEKNINQLDEIIKENEYAIIVENGIGKYVVFDIEYVKTMVILKDTESTLPKTKKSPFTLVESMIKTLEELPNKKTTAKELSFLVEKYYGRRTSAVIIRTRAEENANDKGSLNFFYIEPGNIIGLADGINFDSYMYERLLRAIEYKIDKLFNGQKRVPLQLVLKEIKRTIDISFFSDYLQTFSIETKKILMDLNKYEISNEYLVNK